MSDYDDPRMNGSSSVAQLAKWSDVQRKERVVKETVSSTQRVQAPPVITAAPAKKAVDDSYDDDFEDYNDDFETEEESPQKPVVKPPAPKISAASVAPQSKHSYTSSSPTMSQSPVVTELPASDMAQLKKSMEIENNEAMAKRQQQAKSGAIEGPDSKGQSSSLRPSRLRANDGDGSPSASAPKTATAAPKRAAKFGSLTSGTANSGMSIDPRARRLAKLRASGVLDMQEERISQFNMAPSTLYELYLRELRAPNPTVKQVGVPPDAESRDVEVGTDDIVMVDQEVQASYGDDTALLNIMKVISERKEKAKKAAAEPAPEPAAAVSKKSGKKVMVSTASQATETLLEAAKVSTKKSSGEASEGVSKLSSFLQRASQLCESLLEESSRRNEEMSSKASASDFRRPQSFFEQQSAPTVFGDDLKSGANELVRNRRVVWSRFSPTMPNLLVTAHPYDPADEDDLKPNKAIFCIWDVLSPGTPSFVLECAGTPTCCSFSGTQGFVIIGGTAEGALALWDLREANSIHKDKDSKDLGIEKGVRKACYYTTVVINSQHDLEIEQHSSSIVQVEPVGLMHSEHGATSAAVASQFVSLDACGAAVLWVTSESSSDAATGDYGLSPWGRVSLVQMRVLRVGDMLSMGLSGPESEETRARKASTQGSGSAASATALGAGDGRGGGYSYSPQSTAVLATIPGDVSTFLTAAPRGKVCKLVRFGSSSQTINALGRQRSGDYVEIPLQTAKRAGGDKLEYFSSVTCITVRAGINSSIPSTDVSPSRRRSAAESKGETDADIEDISATLTNFAPLILVGRSDGSVDLHQLDNGAPLQSWSLSTFVVASGKGRRGEETTSAVTMVSWIPRRPAAFVVGDKSGRLFYFDLLQNPFSPLFVESIPGGVFSPGTIDVSPSRAGSRSVYLLAAPGSKDRKGISSLSTRKVNEALLQSNASKADGSGSAGEELILRRAMSSWVGRTSEAEVMGVLSTEAARK